MFWWWKRKPDTEEETQLRAAREVREQQEAELAKTRSMWPSIHLMTEILETSRHENQFSERIMRGARKT